MVFGNGKKKYYKDNVDIKWDFTVPLHLEDLYFKLFAWFSYFMCWSMYSKLLSKANVHLKVNVVNYVYIYKFHTKCLILI